MPDVGVGIGQACDSAHEFFSCDGASGIWVVDFEVVVSLDDEVDISNTLTLSDSVHSDSSTFFNHIAASFFRDDGIVNSSAGIHIIETLHHILDAALALPQSFHHSIRTCLALT